MLKTRPPGAHTAPLAGGVNAIVCAECGGPGTSSAVARRRPSRDARQCTWRVLTHVAAAANAAGEGAAGVTTGRRVKLPARAPPYPNSTVAKGAVLESKMYVGAAPGCAPAIAVHSRCTCFFLMPSQ